MNLIEDFSWTTSDLYLMPELRINQLIVRDHSRVHQSDARIIGVSPSLYNAAHGKIEKIDHYNRTTNLTVTE
jgi:hypothetical protein